MSVPKVMRHRLVEIEFLDHCMNTDVEDVRPLPCTVVGTLIGQCKHAYYIASWLADGQVDRNTESFTILKKVILRVTPLIRGGKYGRTEKRKAKH